MIILEDITSREKIIEDLSEFLKISTETISQSLPREDFYGGNPLSTRVREGWLIANPKTDEEIIEWYKRTNTYILELSYYNTTSSYRENIMEIFNILKWYSPNAKRVFEIGGGIGTFALVLIKLGYAVTFYEIPGMTFDFAKFRFARHLSKDESELLGFLESDGTPLSIGNRGKYDVIFSFDALEHVIDVGGYLKRFYEMLRPGGIFIAQNSFGIGSPSQGGSIPMHLDRNNIWEKKYDPFLAELGFKQLRSWVYQKVE